MSCRSELCHLPNRDIVRGEVGTNGTSLVVTEVIAERVGEIAVDDVLSLQGSDADPGPAVAYVNADGVVQSLFPLSSDGHLLCLDSPMTGPGLTAKEIVDTITNGQSCQTRVAEAGYTQRACDDTPSMHCAVSASPQVPERSQWLIPAILGAALCIRRGRRMSLVNARSARNE